MTIRQEELEQDIPEAYATTDFDLAACMMALTMENGKPFARITNVLPEDGRNQGRPGAGYRFRFHLVCDDGVNVLRKCATAYTNRELSIEPLAFTTCRRQLRAMMDVHITRMRARANRERYPNEQQNRPPKKRGRNDK